MSFITELDVRKVDGKKFAYKLLEDLIWQGNTDAIKVPSGFICDFASTPWLFQRVFPKMGTLSDKPAVLHDWLYVTELFDRKTCDEIFLKAMKERGVSSWKAYSMYYAVRAGGWYVWNKHTLESVNKHREFGGLPLLDSL